MKPLTKTRIAYGLLVLVVMLMLIFIIYRETQTSMRYNWERVVVTPDQPEHVEYDINEQAPAEEWIAAARLAQHVEHNPIRAQTFIEQGLNAPDLGNEERIAMADILDDLQQIEDRIVNAVLMETAMRVADFNPRVARNREVPWDRDSQNVHDRNIVNAVDEEVKNSNLADNDVGPAFAYLKQYCTRKESLGVPGAKVPATTRKAEKNWEKIETLRGMIERGKREKDGVKEATILASTWKKCGNSDARKEALCDALADCALGESGVVCQDGRLGRIVASQQSFEGGKLITNKKAVRESIMAKCGALVNKEVEALSPELSEAYMKDEDTEELRAWTSDIKGKLSEIVEEGRGLLPDAQFEKLKADCIASV